MNLSRSFTLAEMVASDTALRLGIANEPGADDVDNLRRLCATVLEPLRAAIGRPVRVTSGYRCPLLNAQIGGARDSAHMTGRAADIVVENMPPIEVAHSIMQLGLPFDQLIMEFGAWVHVGIAAPTAMPRFQLLTATRQAGRVVYLQGVR